MKLDWPQRRDALRSLFADVDDFQNEQIFIQLSEKFFAQMKVLEQWKKESGAVSTLEDVKKEYSTYVTESVIPWAHQVYVDTRKAVIEALAADATFQLGKTRAVAADTQEKMAHIGYQYQGVSQQDQKAAKEAYAFISKLGKPDAAKFNEHYSKLLNEMLCETVGCA